MVRDVVDQRAPEERPLVDDLAGLDYGLVIQRVRRTSDGRGTDPLGFGRMLMRLTEAVQQAEVTLTPLTERVSAATERWPQWVGN
ncbi:hypothetical protein ACWD4G_07080 [Streptomyces sp. NPDC002643]